MTPAPLLQAVLFDMDGTLVDSEKIWDRTLQELSAQLGGTLSTATREAMVGGNLYDSVTLVHEDLGIVADATESGRYLLDRTKEYFALGLPWQPGARELLDAVRAAGLPTALVTSTHRELVDVALRTIGPHYFDAVVCGDEVSNNKPHPESYLRAAAMLGVDPAYCVAVEDSPTGVASASAAGCVVLVIPGVVPVPTGDRRVLRDSLVGVDVDTLRRLLAAATGVEGASEATPVAGQP